MALTGNGLDKLTTRITRAAMVKLKAECDRRYNAEARFVPYGSVISELIEGHLPDVEPAAARLVPSSARARRKTKAKAA